MRRLDFPTPEVFQGALNRKVQAMNLHRDMIKNVFSEVEKNGDRALKSFTEQFDGVVLKTLTLKQEEFFLGVSDRLKKALKNAHENISKFHQLQHNVKEIETQKGVFCRSEYRPIESVGLYIPGGTAPLFSTLLMLAIPAKLAGCKNIVVCTPPNKKTGKPDTTLQYIAHILGIENIYTVGGSQAIAAMVFGTESIPKVDKIFGPGNQFVLEAKMMALSHGVAIDMPAGPSEVLVIADENFPPKYAAIDLLAQAEHDIQSMTVLLCLSKTYRERVIQVVQEILEPLPRKAIAQKAIEKSLFITVESIEKALELSNIFAPEHLIMGVEKPEPYVPLIQNAGSVFLGKYAPESVGDYASGTNHTLPTNGFSRSFSGISTESFMKKITFQHLTKEGLKGISDTVIKMAEKEQLEAHALAVKYRI